MAVGQSKTIAQHVWAGLTKLLVILNVQGNFAQQVVQLSRGFVMWSNKCYQIVGHFGRGFTKNGDCIREETCAGSNTEIRPKSSDNNQKHRSSKVLNHVNMNQQMTHLRGMDVMDSEGDIDDEINPAMSIFITWV